MGFSSFAHNLRCQNCGENNAADEWPINGDNTPFYNQTETGKYQVQVNCPSCKKPWFVVWDDDPGPMFKVSDVFGGTSILGEPRPKEKQQSEDSFQVAERKIRQAIDSGETQLDLTNMELEMLPDSIGQLSSLQGLRLDINQLTTLPETIGQLSSLRHLTLNSNQLSTLPDSIGSLTSLEVLAVGDNKLTSLSDSIGQLSSLQDLSVYSNQLTSLPETIGRLSSLRKLSVYSSQLTSLPETIGQLSLLQNIFVHSNQLTSLPETIGQLSSLQVLNLGINRLTTLPDSIGQLSSLQKLILGYNQLTSLPVTIGQLSSLQELELQDNQLTTLPENIGELSSLQLLRINSNQLTSLPESIRQLSSLNVFSIHGNDQLGISEKIKITEPQRSIEYYFKIRSIDKTALKGCRNSLVLWGVGMVSDLTTTFGSNGLLGWIRSQTKLLIAKQIHLPNAYHEFGQWVHSGGRHRVEFSSSYDEIDKTFERIKECNEGGPSDEEQSGLGIAVIFMKRIRNKVTLKKLSMMVRRRLSQLGQAVYDAELVTEEKELSYRRIISCRKQIEQLRENVERIDKLHEEDICSPKRIFIIGMCIVAVVVIVW